MDQSLPYPSHLTDEVLAEEPLVCQEISGDDPILDGPPEHHYGRLGLFHEELLFPFSGTVPGGPLLAL